MKAISVCPYFMVDNVLDNFRMMQFTLSTSKRSVVKVDVARVALLTVAMFAGSTRWYRYFRR